MPGAPLLLQANRRHADRHLLDGNAGSTPSNDLENCRWLSPSPGQGHAGSVLCFLLLSPSPLPSAPQMLEAPSELLRLVPGANPHLLAASSRWPFCPFAVTAASKDLWWLFPPAVDVEEWGRSASHQCRVAHGMGAGTVPSHPGPAVGFGRVKGAVRLAGLQLAIFRGWRLFLFCFFFLVVEKTSILIFLY